MMESQVKQSESDMQTLGLLLIVQCTHCHYLSLLPQGLIHVCFISTSKLGVEYRVVTRYSFSSVILYSDSWSH